MIANEVSHLVWVLVLWPVFWHLLSWAASVKLHLPRSVDALVGVVGWLFCIAVASVTSTAYSAVEVAAVNSDEGCIAFTVLSGFAALAYTLRQTGHLRLPAAPHREARSSLRVTRDPVPVCTVGAEVAEIAECVEAAEAAEGSEGLRIEDQRSIRSSETAVSF